LGSEDNYFWKTSKERKETTDRKPFEPQLGWKPWKMPIWAIIYLLKCIMYPLTS
jgi:hypothetical protein